jgi:hypothetical protein
MLLEPVGVGGTIGCSWSRSEDRAFSALRPKQVIKLSGICRIRWTPESARSFRWASPQSTTLEACRIEP